MGIPDSTAEHSQHVGYRPGFSPPSGGLVGPSGEKVCANGTFGSDGQTFVAARGNKGPGYTGSNGNAGPLGAQGQAIDPAAETYKKQIAAYQVWAQQQVENAKNQLGTAGK